MFRLFKAFDIMTILSGEYLNPQFFYINPIFNQYLMRQTNTTDGNR